MLAGERWSDHPSCTHPLLAQLARQVNDHCSDADRQQLAALIPSVVDRRGDDDTWLTVSVAVAASVILDVPEATQHALAGGLLQALQLCDDSPDLVATRRQAQTALEQVPGAVSWVERLGVRNQITHKTFARHCAPTMIRCAVEGVIGSGSPDCDRRLRALLEVGITACPPTPQPALAPVVPGPRQPQPGRSVSLLGRRH